MAILLYVLSVESRCICWLPTLSVDIYFKKNKLLILYPLFYPTFTTFLGQKSHRHIHAASVCQPVTLHDTAGESPRGYLPDQVNARLSVPSMEDIVYICIYIYIYIHIYKYICIYIYIYMYIHLCIYLVIYLCIYLFIVVYLSIYSIYSNRLAVRIFQNNTSAVRIFQNAKQFELEYSETLAVRIFQNHMNSFDTHKHLMAI